MTGTVNRPILHEKQQQLLNPLELHLKGVYNLPSRPVSFERLDATCRPVFARFAYFLPKTLEWVGGSKTHGPTQEWNKSLIILAGYTDKADLVQYIRDNKFTIEVLQTTKCPITFCSLTTRFTTGTEQCSSAQAQPR